MAGFSTTCAIAGATARHRSCSSRTSSWTTWYPSSRPPSHQVRYHGVLAPCAGWRDRVVPARSHPGKAAGTARPLRRYAWADLLRRVFAVDVLECPDCGGRMRLLAAIHPP